MPSLPQYDSVVEQAERKIHYLQHDSFMITKK